MREWREGAVKLIHAGLVTFEAETSRVPVESGTLSPAIVVICRAITARFLFPVASCWSVSPIFLFVSIVPWRAVLFLPENSGTRQNETERNKHNDNLKKPRKSHEDVIIFVLHFWKSFVSAEAIDVYILSKVPPGVVGTSRFIFSFFSTKF